MPGLRVIESDDTGPIPYTDANVRFREAWSRARGEYVELLGDIGGHFARDLLLGDRRITTAQVRLVRAHASQVANHAAAALAAIDEALDAITRAVPDPKEP